MRGNRGRIVVLTAGSMTRKGGQSLRWHALQRALGRHAPCAVHQIGCDRWEECAAACRLSGAPAVKEYSSWYFDRAYCESYLTTLVAELTSTSVSTVVCSGLDTYRYVVELAALGTLDVIFDIHNVELPLHGAIHRAAPSDSIFAKMFSEHHLSLVEAAEGAAVAAADAVWTCTREDRLLVGSSYPGTPLAKVRVVPNVVDVPAPPPVGGEIHRICYTGRFDYFPNYAAGKTVVLDIAPLVEQVGCDKPVVVAGAFAEVAFGDQPVPPNVRLVSDHESNAAVVSGSIMVVPLTIGGGSRFKILEAFALGAPVVSTAKGVEGLDLVAGKHYLRAEEPAEFAEHVGSLVRDQRLRAGLARDAWQLVNERYSIDALADELADVFPPERP